MLIFCVMLSYVNRGKWDLTMPWSHWPSLKANSIVSKRNETMLLEQRKPWSCQNQVFALLTAWSFNTCLCYKVFFLSLFHMCFFTPLWLIWRRKCISHIDSCRSFLVVQNCVTMTAGQVSPSQERMQVALEELADLKGVWSELARVWEQIDELKEKPWLSVAPRKVWMWKSWGFCGC